MHTRTHRALRSPTIRSVLLFVGRKKRAHFICSSSGALATPFGTKEHAFALCASHSKIILLFW